MRPFLKRKSIFGTNVFGVRRTGAFRAQTFPHVETLYSEAFCLTGCPEQAADLVVTAYLRAYQDYGRFRRLPVPTCRRAGATHDWLLTNLCAAFCAGILAQAPQDKSPTGDEPC